jgi:hypothetical protein
MAYIGSTPTTQSFISGTDYFNGDGTTVAFTMSRSVASVNDIQAVVNNVVQVPNDAYTISGTTITFTSAPSAGTSNVYVRYLSTTTQSITPSQGTVGWSQLNSDTQQDLGISFKNRIINGAMAIDQRNAGATQAITSAGTPTYCLDRWAVSLGNTASGTLTTQRVAGDAINQYAVRIARTAGTYADNIRFYQVIETSNCYDLQGKNITISWRAMQGSSYTGGAQVLTIITGSGTDQGIASMVSGTWTSSAFNFPTVTGTLSTSFSTFTATFAVPAGTTEIGLRISTGNFSGTGSANDYLDITGVQLEVGTQATTFDYRSIGTELALCQRYYEFNGQSYNCVWNGNTTSGSTYYKGVTFIVTKRATPTIATITNLSQVGFPATASTATDLSIGGFQLSRTSNSTVNSGYFIDTWVASAEL